MTSRTENPLSRSLEKKTKKNNANYYGLLYSTSLGDYIIYICKYKYMRYGFVFSTAMFSLL